MATRPDLSLLVPVHNEERRLPEVLAALRRQTMPRLSVVLVDNASTDGSARVLAACPEVRSGQWTLLREPRIGKFHALRTANAFVASRLRSPLVGLLDADTELEDASWLERASDAGLRAGTTFGFAHCVFRYSEIDHLPRLAAAIRAGEDTVSRIVQSGVWFALGCCSVFAADVLTSYLERAVPAAEMDLRQSLHALRLGREAIFVPGLVRSTARRIIATRGTLRRWSFYDRRYYRDRDINGDRKIDLESSPVATDVVPEAMDRLLERRGRKVASRNVVPIAIYERQGRMLAWAEARLSARGRASLRDLRRNAAPRELYLSERFEDLVRSIERRSAGRELSAVVAAMMREDYAARAEANADDRAPARRELAAAAGAG